mgnify:CR=1 FL=1
MDYKVLILCHDVRYNPLAMHYRTLIHWQAIRMQRRVNIKEFLYLFGQPSLLVQIFLRSMDERFDVLQGSFKLVHSALYARIK